MGGSFSDADNSHFPARSIWAICAVFLCTGAASLPSGTPSLWNWTAPTSITDAPGSSETSGALADLRKDDDAGQCDSAEEALIVVSINSSSAAPPPFAEVSPDNVDWYRFTQGGRRGGTTNLRNGVMTTVATVPLNGSGQTYFRFNTSWSVGTGENSWTLLACRSEGLWNWIDGGGQTITDQPLPTSSAFQVDLKKDDDATAAECADGDEALIYGMFYDDPDYQYMQVADNVSGDYRLMFTSAESDSVNARSHGHGYQGAAKLDGSGSFWLTMQNSSGSSFTDIDFRVNACRKIADSEGWSWFDSGSLVTDTIADSVVAASPALVDFRKDDTAGQCDSAQDALVMFYGATSSGNVSLYSSPDGAVPYAQVVTFQQIGVGAFDDRPCGRRVTVRVSNGQAYFYWSSSSTHSPKSWVLLGCR